jgi:hypothetical protein
MKELEEVRQYKPIEYDEMPGDMVTAVDYDTCLKHLKVAHRALEIAEESCRHSARYLLAYAEGEVCHD